MVVSLPKVDRGCSSEFPGWKYMTQYEWIDPLGDVE